MRVGKECPPSSCKMAKGWYHGPITKLYCKTALLQIDEPNGIVYAQFDDRDTGRGYGWWKYRVEDWGVKLLPLGDI